MQPFFGFISDKFGLKKRLIWLLVAMLLPVGPFFIYFTRRCWCTASGWARCLAGSIWGSFLTPAAG
jgi:OHS family lactose permease-like MFS transporter